MTINLTPIFQSIIGLMAALITYKLIPWIRAKTTNEQRIRLDAAIRAAAFAAEQIFGSGHGADKMDYALRWLREQGFDVDSREVEAVVGELFNIAKAENILAVIDTDSEAKDGKEA